MLLAGLLGGLLAGCMTPFDGDRTDDNRVTSTRTFNGVSNVGSTSSVQRTVRVDVLTDRSNPSNAASWKALPTVGVLETEVHTLHDYPYYFWGFESALTGIPQGAWPPGGVIAYRSFGPIVDGAGNVGNTFYRSTDEDWLTCVSAESARQPPINGLEIAARCMAPYADGISHSIDTTPNPAIPAVQTGTLTPQPPPFLTRKKFLLAEADQGNGYYTRVNGGANGGTKNRVPLKFDSTTNPVGFRQRYGFNNAGNAGAVYYNYGDLGLGRRMVCRNFSTPSSGQGVACYVTNYVGDVNGQPFGAYNENLRDTALQHAESDQHALATVAMAWDPSESSEPVVFGVYNGSESQYRAAAGADPGVLLANAVLDNLGRVNPDKGNVLVPTNCLTCHGGTASVDGSKRIVGAVFLPFDLQNFKFSSQGSFTEAAQQASFKSLNQLVKQTVTSTTVEPKRPALAELITGWYNNDDGTNPNNLNFRKDFVPPGWTPTQSTPWTKKLYEKVYEPYCQGCHVTQNGLRGSASLSFASYADFSSSSVRASLVGLVCGFDKNTGGRAVDHNMPHAEMTAKHFWDSTARAHLLSALSEYQGCGQTD